MSDESMFGSSITLTHPVVLNVSRNLSFPPQTAGYAADVTTSPDDSNSAVFSATGEASASVQATVLENSITMTSGVGTDSSEQMIADNWTYGGNLSNTGNASFDQSGVLDDLRVGATVHIKAENVPGLYVGMATLRLAYQ